MHLVFKFIFDSVFEYRWRFLVLFFILLHSAIHISLQPYIVKIILESYELNPIASNLIVPMTSYIMLLILFNLNTRSYDYISLKFYPELRMNIVSKISKTVFQHEYMFFQNEFSGTITAKIRELSHGTVEIIRILSDRCIGFFFTLFIASFTLKSVHPLLCLTLLFYTLIIMGISFIYRKKISDFSRSCFESSSQVSGTMVDQFSNILNIRLFSTTLNEQKKLDSKLNIEKKHEKQLRFLILKIMFFQGLSTVLMIAVCFFILIFPSESNLATVGDFGLVFTMTISITSIILSFSNDIPIFIDAFGKVIQGLNLINHHKNMIDIPNAKKIHIRKGRIEFINVSFGYTDKKMVFENLSLKIYPGQRVGVVGYSGSGKSTLINLILRLFDVNFGKIMIDGQDISKVIQESLRHAIAVIPQEITLFHSSILENISYGKLGASIEEVICASKKATIHEFIISLPDGYQTLVGERGVKLSGGQKQKIAIARAILKNSPILLLDESTSAIDSLTENLIVESLYGLAKDKTVIAISHRLSTLLCMDRILVLDRGKIVEDGSHQELLQRKGLYKSFWDSQIDGFIQEKNEKMGELYLI